MKKHSNLMKINNYLKLFCVFSCCTVLGAAKAEAQAGDALMSYKAVGIDGYPIVSGTVRFPNAFYTPDQYCAENHLAPDKQKYPHSHTTDPFPFYCDAIGANVTVQNSDQAWQYYYNDTRGPGYELVSSSSFLQNCYSYITKAPTPIESEAFYPHWTFSISGTSLEHRPTGKQSYTLWRIGIDHAVGIDKAGPVNETGPVQILRTLEKNASGPVFKKTYPNGMPGYPYGVYLFFQNRP